jgi:hypothetical protein
MYMMIIITIITYIRIRITVQINPDILCMDLCREIM